MKSFRLSSELGIGKMFALGTYHLVCIPPRSRIGYAVLFVIFVLVIPILVVELVLENFDGVGNLK